ncbi:MAG TPA: hypothetical protein VGL92_08880 [Acidimicrobiia bacterium]
MGDLSSIPQPPSGLEMNAVGQTIFTIGVTIPWLVAIVLAVRYWRRHGTPIPLLFLAGGALCILFEPVVDVLGQVLFPRENQWVGLEVFGRPIPMFMWPVYSWFVGGQAFLVWYLLRRGMTRNQLWKFWLAVMGINVVLETPGLLMDVYTYYGHQPFNPWGLPLWWPPVNATMPIVAGYLVYKMTPHLTGWRVLAVIPMVPMADGMANGAIAWPVWTALNTNLGMAATYPAAVLVFGLAALAVWIMGTGLPVSAPATAPSAVREPALTGQPEALATT